MVLMTRLWKHYSILLFILAAVIVAKPDCARAENAYPDLRERFDRASVLYSESNFEDARNIYEEIIGYGYESGALYYNLGNAYLKTGFLGKALLNYERALRIMPYDSDLKSNLRYANSLRQEPAMESTPLWVNRRLDSLLGMFTTNGLTKVLSAIYVLAIVFLGLAIFKKDMRKAIGKIVISLGFVFLITITLLSCRIYQTEHIVSAIILTDIADARFEPLDEAPIHFKLYEGSKITVLKTRGQWSQIKREDNKIGWIESDNYDII
jgi:tetratricopeptide (TPR) repeat protein